MFDIAASATLGLFAVLIFTDYGLVPALFAGAALSATSVGVSTEVWRSYKALETPEGALLVDVAELDDISAVLIMSVLFTVVPALQAGVTEGVLGQIGVETLWLLAKLGLILAVCFAFSVWLEPTATRWFSSLDRETGAWLWAAGAALMISAMAAASGLSAAVGALLAGVAFSRDSLHESIDRSLDRLHAFFVPFFFVSIGLAVDPGSLFSALGLGGLLLLAAIAGKLIGAGAPASLMIGRRSGWLIGFSMAPRAEIALIISSYGLAFGAWAMPPGLFSAIVIVSLGTCLVGPVVVNWLLAKRRSAEH